MTPRPTPLSRRRCLGILPAVLLLGHDTPVAAAPAIRDIFRAPQVAALVEAALTHDAARAAALVAAGASPNAQGDRDVTLLQWAMLSRSHVGFGILLNLGADPAQPGLEGDSALHFAAKANDPAYLRMILERGGSIDARNAFTGRTPLMAALMGDRTLQMQMLRAAGARLDVADSMGNTVLHIAAQINNSAQVLALLEQGAPPRARNRQGKTFQTYIFMTPERVLNARARAERQAIIEWLSSRGIAQER